MTMMARKLWSLSALATEMQINVRTAARMLAGVEPDGRLATRPAWHLATAIKALGEYQAQSDRLNDRRLNGSAGAPPDPSLAKLESLARDVTEGLRRLRAAPPDERVEVLQGFGASVGRLDSLLGQTIAAQGPGADTTLAPFHHELMAATVREIIELVGCETVSR
jgi:hypothetical protein